jgi:hypothetical protein
MRDMPFPSWLNADTTNRINLYYSLSQLFAICGVLIMGLDEVRNEMKMKIQNSNIINLWYCVL